MYMNVFLKFNIKTVEIVGFFFSLIIYMYSSLLLCFLATLFANFFLYVHRYMMFVRYIYLFKIFIIKVMC